MATIMEELANVEPRERYKQLFRRLRTEYEKRGLPLSGRFELTPHCTLDCKMCYVHRSDGKYPHRVLTGDEWIDIMDQAIDMGMLRATLTGGECMLHPDFKRIYTHLKQRGVMVSMLTNGTLIDEDLLELFREMPPCLVQVSLYGSNPQVYQRVTGSADAFNKVCNALHMLDKAKIITNISLTISKYNMDDAGDMWNLAHQLTRGKVGFDFDMFDPIEDSRHEFALYALSYDEKLRVAKQLLRLSDRECRECLDCEDGSQAVKKVSTYPLTMPCAAGLSLFFVTYAGKMMPCTSFPLAEADLTQESVRAAWERVNNAAKQYRRSEECTKCEHLGKCFFCAARYATNSGGAGGVFGNIPCNKKELMLLPRLYNQK